MPFHLQALGYSEISVLVGYLLFAYVRITSLVVHYLDPLFIT
jgi:hypothetical protein